jgi:hypothetical protein
MGRSAGWIAAGTVLAKRGKPANPPHIILLPELPFEEEKFLAKVKEKVGIPVLSDVHRTEDVDRAKEVYEKAFGLKIRGRYVVDEFKAECAFILVGNVYIELVRPLADDGLKKFLDKRGSGTLHHICYIVET